MPHRIEESRQYPSFARAEDTWFIGHLGHSRPGRIVAHRHTATNKQIVQEAHTLDEGLDCLLHAEEMPDLTQYPATHRVYGPKLASWGGACLLGLVWSNTHNLAPGITNLNAASFVAMDPDGRVCAKMQQLAHAWKITVVDPAGQALVRQRKDFDAAMVLFVSACAQRIAAGSRHAAMDMITDTPGIVLRSAAFLVQREAYRSQIVQGPAPLPLAIHDVKMIPWNLVRLDDRFHLGEITLDRRHFVAVRQGLRDNAYEDRDSLRTHSLDQAVAFLAESPHAPDLTRFPDVAFLDYGCVLWTLPLCSLVGFLASVDMSRQVPGVCFKVLNRPEDVVGHYKGAVLATISQDPTTQLWTATGAQIGQRDVWTTSPDLASVLTFAQDTMIRMHRAEHHPGMQAAAPQALAGMMDFIARRNDLIAEFERGNDASG